MAETWQFDPVLVGAELHEIQAWLSANGVEPGDVPTDAKVVVEGDSMTIDVHLRNERGSKYVDTTTGFIARGAVTVPFVMATGLRSLVRIGEGALPS